MQGLEGAVEPQAQNCLRKVPLSCVIYYTLHFHLNRRPIFSLSSIIWQ